MPGYTIDSLIGIALRIIIVHNNAQNYSYFLYVSLSLSVLRKITDTYYFS